MSKFHPLVVKDIRNETADCVSVALEVPAALKTDFHFKAGQYLTLRKEINGEDVRRSYSICSSPLEEELRVAIKKIEDGRFSTFANEKLQIGDQLEVMPPLGNFTLSSDKTQANKYVAFVAGSGITPVMSILKTVMATEPDSHFTLIYGNRGFDSIIFRESIEDLKNEYLNRLTIHHVFSKERMDIPLFNGRIDADKCGMMLDKLVSVPSISEWFICGPEEMIFAVKDTLLAKSVPAEKIHFELFTSPVGKLGTKKEEVTKTFDPSLESKITIKLDGTAFDFALPYDGENVLDAALKEGADLPFACKGGVCCTCRAKLVSGEVEMDVNYALEADEVAAGFILTCQSHPRTPTIVVDFDQQ